MTVRPVRVLPVDARTWLEIEAIDTAADTLVIAGRQFVVNSEQRVVHVFADDNAGVMSHHFLDLRIGSAVADYGLWDPVG